MKAQGGGDAAPIPQLPFHLVDNFFHYPSNSVIGRVSGIAVAPSGNILALNRGYHPVLEFKSDGTFVRSWGEGSTMFVGAHSLRFDPQGNLWYVDAADNIIYRFDSEGRTVGTLGTNPEPWTWLTHVIEHAAPGRAAFYQETDIGWSKDGSMFVSDGYGNSRVAKFDKDGNFVKAWGERGTQPGDFNTPHSLVVDRNDVVYVADRGNSRIQVFDTDGELKACLEVADRALVALPHGWTQSGDVRGQRGPSLQDGSCREKSWAPSDAPAAWPARLTPFTGLRARMRRPFISPTCMPRASINGSRSKLGGHLAKK